MTQFYKREGSFLHHWSLFSEIAKTFGFGPTPTSGCCGDLWSKNIFLILVCDDIIFQKKGGLFLHLGVLFPRSLKCAVLDHPTVDNGVVSRGRSVALAVGCWHFNGTSTVKNIN